MSVIEIWQGRQTQRVTMTTMMTTVKSLPWMRWVQARVLAPNVPSYGSLTIPFCHLVAERISMGHLIASSFLRQFNDLWNGPQNIPGNIQGLQECSEVWLWFQCFGFASAEATCWHQLPKGCHQLINNNCAELGNHSGTVQWRLQNFLSVTIVNIILDLHSNMLESVWLCTDGLIVQLQ